MAGARGMDDIIRNPTKILLDDPSGKRGLGRPKLCDWMSWTVGWPAENGIQKVEGIGAEMRQIGKNRRRDQGCQ